jgi:hypothetical protein
MLNVAIAGLFLFMARPVSGHAAPLGAAGVGHAARSAAGKLTVTAVVSSSVSVTFDAEGRPVIVVANAPADAATLNALAEPALSEAGKPKRTAAKAAEPPSVTKMRNRRERGDRHASSHQTFRSKTAE